MAIKTILAPLTGYEKNGDALVSGFRFASGLGAFVEVLHVKPDPRDMVPMIGEGSAGPAIAQIMEIAEKDAELHAAQAQRLFDEASRKTKSPTATGVTTRFVTITGRWADEVTLRGRVADLVMMGRVPQESETEWRLTLEAALMEGGRPVLLLPIALREQIGKVVALAWNGSLEAARAASAALPILERAERVLLLAGEKDAAIEPSLDSLAGWLRHHGIKGEQKRVALKGWPVGEQLVDEAAAAGADLLVMGAYGHSRMRETIFGGATRAVLNEAKLPVLLAH